jgi:hypothetical protein
VEKGFLKLITILFRTTEVERVAAAKLHATSVAADESNRSRAVKVGGDDGHERKIFRYRTYGSTE